MEIYFAMAIRMLLLYMKPLFLSVFQFFSVNRKRIVLLTLFCLLKNRNNGNFTVPIHKIPVMALLIIRIINFRFRFKRGTAISLFTGGYNAFKSYSLIPPERYRIQKYENIINLCFILRIY